MATAKEESLLSQTRLFVTEKGGGRSQWWWWWMGWVQRLRRGAGCRGCLGTSRLTPRLLLLSAASWDKFYALEIKVLNVICSQLPSLVSLFILWSPAASWTLRCSSKSTLPACYSDSLKTAPAINNLDRLVTLIQHSVSRCGTEYGTYEVYIYYIRSPGKKATTILRRTCVLEDGFVGTEIWTGALERRLLIRGSAFQLSTNTGEKWTKREQNSAISGF